MKEYYKAYEDRYKIYHEKTGDAWAGERPTFELKDLLDEFGATEKSQILEIGCGEGQNALFLQENGFDVFASDVSQEAVNWCKDKAKTRNLSPEKFFVLDILDNNLQDKFDFIISVSTLHMLVLDSDRKAFFDFVYSHLNEDGFAIITSMGDGKNEKNDSDISKAFDLIIRNNGSGDYLLPTTSCRIVNWKTLFKEIENSSLALEKHYLSTTISGFNSSLVVVLKKANK